MRIGIVGCGICGSYLGYKLSKEHDVTIFEQRKMIGKDVCSGLVSERLWNFIPYNKDLIINKINSVLIHYPKKTVKLNFEPKMLVVDHKLLDQYVASLAEKNGAKISLENRVVRLFHMKNRRPQLSVEFKNKTDVYEFDHVIGCDGPNSIIRKQLGIKDPKFRLGILGFVSKKDDSNIVETYPTENGFFWKIPRVSNVEYGILENVDVAKEKFKRFCSSKRIPVKEIYSALIPSGLTQVVKNRVALCGDACGLTKPWSSGGIVWGLTAADILIKNLHNFDRYERDLKRFFEAKIFYSNLTDKLSKTFDWMLPKETWIDSDWIF